MGNKSGKPKIQKGVSNAEMGARLKQVPLLSKYTVEDLDVIGGQFTVKTYKKGDKIMKQGDEGDGFYIIDKGEVQVSTKNSEGKEQQIAVLKDSDYVGEAALLSNKARGATVTCTTKVSTYFLSRADFQKVFGAKALNVQFAKRVAKRAAVTAGTNVHGTKFKAPDGAKKPSGDIVSKIKEAVKDNLLFTGLDDDVKTKVIAEMWLEDYAAGKDCITQGAKGGELFYVVEEGKFTILVENKEVTTMSEGTCFGELALLHNAPRAATVRAETDSKVWAIHRHIFRSTVESVTTGQLNKYSEFLLSVDLLSPLSHAERAEIAGALEQKDVKAGSVIFEQGVEGSTFYIVQKGAVTIEKDGEKVATLKAGQYFGERALQTKENRAAKAVAEKDTTLLLIDKTTFDNLLGPLESILSQKIESYAGHNATKDQSERKTTDIPFEQLEILGTLGKGSFGHVQLVKDKKSNATFALKGVSKSMIVETGQEGHIMSEKNVMAMLKHPFLINLFQTYKNQDQLFFLLEPALGGELFTYLRAQTLFVEDSARFYAACVLLSFEYMHSFDILYRDLKPENILIDRTGYIKITDFGFAKQITGRTWTLCGTPDYLAPEIVAGKGHGKGVDWWTLGILIFEMLASYPPFFDDDTMKTYRKIMTREIDFPDHFSKSAVSLCRKLLYRKPTRRLGVVKGGAALVKAHAWFSNSYGSKDGWKQLLNKELKAPFIPKIADDFDLTNFEECEEDEPIMPYEDDGSNPFEDF